MKAKTKGWIFPHLLESQNIFLGFSKQIVTWATADSVFVQNICRLAEILQYKDVGKFQYSHSSAISQIPHINVLKGIRKKAFMYNVLSVCNYQPNIFKTHFGLTISAVLKIVIWLAVCEHAEAHDFSQMTI